MASHPTHVSPLRPAAGLLLAAGIIALAVPRPGAADPQATAPPVSSTATPAGPSAAASNARKPEPKRPTLEPFGSFRVREEVWDWFGDLAGADDYRFTGTLLRVGAAYQSRKDDLTIELSQPGLWNLPHDATAAPPLGQLGLGAVYRDANGGQQAGLFIKQGFWRHRGLGGEANTLQVGRFEFVDGTETAPKDPSLAWLKRERIAHRLLGNFGWSHVQRSYDGGRFTYNTPNLNVTAVGAMPTEGVFDLDGNNTLEDVHVGYLAATAPLSGRRFAGEARLFGLYYRDDRPGVLKSDNRPAAALASDPTAIGLATVGGHWLGIRDVGPGTFDGLLWGALQWGDWGRLDHGALAFSAEAGFQPKGIWGKPWFRAGYSHFSGDGSGANGQHGTFFPVLPTPRVYARFPFYTEMNLDDAFVQAILKPHPKVTVRADAHKLSLASADDLWYGGGGAFQPMPGFGFGGRPSSGATDLGWLLDVSVDYAVRKHTTLTGYFGYATGGKVQDRIYGGGGRGFLGYLELTQTW